MFSVPELPYAYDALEGYISADIMRLHHDKHHQAYVNKLNKALEGHDEFAGLAVEDILRRINEVPENIRTTVRNNGGGHYNHSLFWVWMTPQGTGNPGGELEATLAEKYGSFEAFQQAFSDAAAGVFGSGWVWLQPNLEIKTTPNQDSLLLDGEPEPILGLDVWEHAYYLDYQNRRPEYIAAWWKVVNWDVVRERYERLTA